MAHLRDALVAATAAALSSEAGRPENVHIDVPADQFIAAARAARLVGLLAGQGSAIGLPPTVIDALKQSNQDVTMRALRMAARTLQVTEILDAAGIPTLVIKGLALSLQTTGTLNARDTRDIDLLVSADDMPRAHTALLDAGARVDFVLTPGSGTAWRHARWATRELAYRLDDVAVDLHWRVAVESDLFPRAEVLIARAERVGTGTSRFNTFSRGDALAAACASAYIDHYPLRYLVDLHRLLQDPPALPPDHCRQLRQLVADTLAFAEELLPGWPQTRGPLGLGGVRPDTRHAWQEWHAPRRGYASFTKHTNRYAPSRVSSSARVVSMVALYPHDVDSEAGARGFARAIAIKLRRASTQHPTT